MDKKVGEHHWVGRKPDPNKYFGFIYVITNLVTGKKYVGKKQYHRWVKGKKGKESDWRFYTGSSKWLHRDIRKYGKDKFEFRIYRNFETRGGLVYAECNYQHKWNVLTELLEGSTERAWYNAMIGAIKFIPKEY